MTHGDALIWICIGLSALAVLSCIAVAAHRSFGTRPDDRTEYDAYWRDGAE